MTEIKKKIVKNRKTNNRLKMQTQKENTKQLS